MLAERLVPPMTYERTAIHAQPIPDRTFSDHNACPRRLGVRPGQGRGLRSAQPPASARNARAVYLRRLQQLPARRSMAEPHSQLPLRSATDPARIPRRLLDQLGWPDRFSRNQYTKRQQQASDRNRAEFVYTPQFLLDGKDIRPVHTDGVLNTRLAPINKEAARAQITAQVTLSAAREIALQGTATLTQTNTTAETFIVLYENGISSKVAAGENAGKTLQHDFVVRALVGPIFSSAQGVAKLEHRIPLPADARINALGVAVFTQDAATGIVLQVAAAENCFTP